MSNIFPTRVFAKVWQAPCFQWEKDTAWARRRGVARDCRDSWQAIDSRVEVVTPLNAQDSQANLACQPGACTTRRLTEGGLISEKTWASRTCSDQFAA